MEWSPLYQLIARFEASGELARIPVTVDPLLEIAAVSDRICKQTEGGTALLFEHPRGSEFPVVTNLFSSVTRICTALGVTNLNELTVRLRALLDQIVPSVAYTAFDCRIAALPDFARFAPHVSTSPDSTLKLMDPPNLSRFPFLHSWPEDGAADGYPRYMTLPQVFTTDPDGGSGNCGMYRVQLRGAAEVAIQWKAGSGAARHAEQYHRSGKGMPVAIVLGGHPATLFSAICPLPGDLDEMTFAGFLRGTPLVMSPCLSIPLSVPEGAELVIEGIVEPGESVMEGPFGNHTGCYAPAAPAALLRVTAIRYRPDAVIPATVVGRPPMEDCWMALVWERLLLAFLQTLVPSIRDIHIPFEWAFTQSTIISLENPQPGMVRNISAQLWSLPWFRSARLLIFVAADTAPTDLSRVAWQSINGSDARRDVIHDSASGRIAIDGTDSRLQRTKIAVSDELAAQVSHRWKEYRLP